jgi:2-polyprenyl-3-methyl-5-hydroxy-6-metoxy-1,4-benzoquinol methylase
MEINGSNPIRAAQFLEALRTKLRPARGTFIHDACIRDALEKTNAQDSSGYVRWLRRLFDLLIEQENCSGRRTLDFGCGTGELTVLMKLVGFDSIGIDDHLENIKLARSLAGENGLAEDMFVWNQTGRLPFADGSFDIVTMISVLEHLDDPTLAALIPELARVCKGGLFLQAPSGASFRDDHTGLRFVPLMPHWFAKAYIAARGSKYRYSISSSGTWDVHYRNLDEVISMFGAYFHWRFAPALCSYPEPSGYDSITSMGKHFQIANREIFLGIPLPWRRLRINRGYPKQAYYPYLNLIFTPKNSR